MIQIKAENGAQIQVTDKPIYNTLVMGDLVQQKVVTIGAVQPAEQSGEQHAGQSANQPVGQSASQPQPAEATHGPRKQFLFIDGRPYCEHVAVRECEKKRFMNYLSRHKLGSRPLVCLKDDTLNDVVTCFVLHWQERGLTAAKPSGGAIFRFLTETCGMATSVTEDSYSNEIKERLNRKRYTVETYRQVSQSF